MATMMIDDQKQAALRRLTENEKDCLRRRLRHQTAKEMALDLGISPHAVEKRLKMARTKLGLSSSLDAAQLLVASEEYQRTAPQAPDLETGAPQGKKRFTRNLALGAIVMSLLAATLIVFAVQPPGSGGVAPLDAGGVAPYPSAGPAGRAVPPGAPPAIHDQFEPDELVKPTPAEVGIIVRDSFANADKDRSGYIEGYESPYQGDADVMQPIFTRSEDGKALPTGKFRRITIEQARAEFIAESDKNGDGRIDFTEYQHAQSPKIAERGIPKAWRDDMNRPITQ
jgi:DNA-binding CsgD family transcriptional regulator